MADSLFNNPPELPDCVDDAVSNLTAKPTQAIGQTMADLWFLAFGGISQAAEKRRIKYNLDLQEFKADLERRIQKIPENKQAEPNTQTILSALDNARYCVEEPVLRKMFANLIASSLNSDTVDSVHPSFSDIVRKMTPLDAINLARFVPRVSFPIVQYKLILSNSNKYHSEPYVASLFNPQVSDIMLQSRSITALQMLGLIRLDFSQWLADDNAYEPFEQTNEFKELEKRVQSSENPKYECVSIIKGMACLTSIGIDFLEVCLPSISATAIAR